MDSIISNTKCDVVLFVGSNPSNASTMDVAFHGSTKSSKILTEWVSHIPAGKLPMYINVLNEKTENNRPLKKSEIKANLGQLESQINAIKPTYIIALGNTAADALTLLRLDFYKMPHPSGRNRQLNDPWLVAEKVKGLTEFVSKPSLELPK